MNDRYDRLFLFNYRSNANTRFYKDLMLIANEKHSISAKVVR